MPHINSNRRPPSATAIVAALALLLACIGLAACGGSSTNSSTSANASATTSPTGGSTDTAGTTGTSATGTGATAARGRFKALRECLRKDGITLPQRAPGQRGAGGFFSGGAGPQLPKGVTRAQYETAIKKCGGGAFAGRGARLKNPAYEAGLAKFAACMRENGVNVPPPNTSGSGPIFDTKGLNTTSARFRTAESKCIEDLRSASRRGVAPGAAPPSSSSTG